MFRVPPMKAEQKYYELKPKHTGPRIDRSRCRAREARASAGRNTFGRAWRNCRKRKNIANSSNMNFRTIPQKILKESTVEMS